MLLVVSVCPELTLHQILSFIDDPKVLARASQVSQRWRVLLSDDMTWKNLCVKHDYDRRLSEVYAATTPFPARPPLHPLITLDSEVASSSFPGAMPSSSSHSPGSRSFDGTISSAAKRPKLRSYKSHFKQRYLVEAAWRSGGTSITRNITQEGGVVTSLHLTPKYIIVALDNAKIHVFDTEGDSQRTMQGHVMGVWAMVPWEDTLVSGGCDRDVRVWDLKTGYAPLHDALRTGTNERQGLFAYASWPYFDGAVLEDGRRKYCHFRVERYHAANLGHSVRSMSERSGRPPVKRAVP